jgi:hypothetical protein
MWMAVDSRVGNLAKLEFERVVATIALWKPSVDKLGCDRASTDTR